MRTLARVSKLLKGLVLACAFPAVSQAAVIYDSWISNGEETGNYIVTVTEVNGDLAFNLTVDPWNAEALALFVDLGDLDVGIRTLTTVSNISTGPTSGGSVIVFATDTTSQDCGKGCNLNGLKPPLAMPDGDWELVFRLGSQGWESIQTIAFTVSTFGVEYAESDLGLMGIRAQQLCPEGTTLPSNTCGGSDKAYGIPSNASVPEPGSAALLAVGLVGLAGWKRKPKRVIRA